MKKSIYDPTMMKSIDRAMVSARRIVDELLWIHDDDLDEATAAVRELIKRHPLFLRDTEKNQPKSAIINVLTNLVPQDPTLKGMEIYKITERLSKFNGIAGLRREMERIVVDESVHIEMRTLIDTLLIKHKNKLRKN